MRDSNCWDWRVVAFITFQLGVAIAGTVYLFAKVL